MCGSIPFSQGQPTGSDSMAMFAPLTDVMALAGIALVAGMVCLAMPGMVSSSTGQSNVRGRWLAAMCFVAMWLPVGAVPLPVAAYVRGITSDLSVSLMALAALSLCSRLFGLKPFDLREYKLVFLVASVAALFLYPLALGLGDWDAYRPGWGSAAMWTILFLVCVAGWLAGFRLLPLLIALALLAWTARLLESNNLWDYLLDPWLAFFAIFRTLRTGAQSWLNRGQRRIGGAMPPPVH